MINKTVPFQYVYVINYTLCMERNMVGNSNGGKFILLSYLRFTEVELVFALDRKSQGNKEYFYMYIVLQ